jgi:hypothetical protein
MAETIRRRWVIGGLLVLAAVIFGAGINWGLPSHDIDPFLFGSENDSPTNFGAYRYTGVGIERLAGNWNDDANVAADVAAHPITDRAKPVTLLDQSSPDANVSRARILRRYRLYSNQPDEMITFRALASMHPGQLQFDPKLYQYGGLWIYPVGVILKAASVFGYATVTSDTTTYLDSPDLFGKFYILTRAYSAAWGLIAVLAVFALVRRISGGLLLPALAAICFICMPVVVDLAHEAKPHLAGTALILLSVLAAAKYVETGRWKWIVWTAIACGASAGMVLSGAVALAILPAMAIARRDKPGRFAGICIVGFVVSAAVYFVSNPYVAIHLLGNHRILESNLSNTRAMYTVGVSATNTARLIAAGMSWPLAIAGACGAVYLLFTRKCLKGLGWTIFPPAGLVLIQFALVSADKPGEYARFAIFPDTALMLAAFFAISQLHSIPLRGLIGSILVISAAVYSAAYERGFLSDDSRIRSAEQINGLLSRDSGQQTLNVIAELAPYCLPPVNLFRWNIVLLPRGDDHFIGVFVKADDSVNIFDPCQTPISWANKPFDVVDSGGR